MNGPQINNSTITDDPNRIQLIESTNPETVPLIKPVQPARLTCLDIFRGLTMMGMIMVDNMGDFSHVIWPLNETEWNGLSTADLVFPSFLFIGGMSVVLAIKPESNNGWKVWLKVFKRFVILFMLGFLLNTQARIQIDFKRIRVMGVLQRTSICYLLVTSTYILCPKFYHNLFVYVILISIYLGFMYGYDVPTFVYHNNTIHDCGKGVLTTYCNFGAFVDQHIFGQQHMMWPNDPEGLFTTLNASVTYFLGVVYMKIMRSVSKDYTKLFPLWLSFSSILFVSGMLLSTWIPLNKKIWSLSFVLTAGGCSGYALTFCLWLFDLSGLKFTKKLQNPFIWMGMNPLFVFVGMEIWDIILMVNINFSYKGTYESLWNFINDFFFRSWLRSYYLSSLVVSLLSVLMWTIFCKLLYDRKIFIKI